MPDLTTQQKSQLDSNIKAMLGKGASQDDVIKYSKDFRSKYNIPVKKKEDIGSYTTTAKDLLKQFSPQRDNVASGQTIQNRQIAESKVKENEAYIADKPNRVKAYKEKVQAKHLSEPEVEKFNPEEYLKQDIDTDGSEALKQINASKEVLGVHDEDPLHSGALDLKGYWGIRKNQLDTKENELRQHLKGLQAKKAYNNPYRGDVGGNILHDTKMQHQEETPLDEQDIYSQLTELQDKRNKLTQAVDAVAKKYTHKINPNASNKELAKFHGELMNDEKSAQIKRFEEKGITVNEEDKLHEDINGLEVRKSTLENEYEGKEKDDTYYEHLYDIESAQKNAINQYPELKKKKIAELVVQELGSNGAHHLVQLASSGDKEALKMLSEKTGIPVSDLRFLETGDLPTEKMLSNALKGIYNAGTGILTGVHRFIGGGLGEDKDRITSINQSLLESGDNIFGNSPTEHSQQPNTILNSDLEQVINPNAGKYDYNATSVKNMVGDAFGSLIGFVGGTKGLGALGLGERAAMWTNVIASGYENKYQQANEIIGKDANEGKKHLFALLTGAAEAAAFEFLPKEKLGLSVSKSEAKEFAEIVKSGTINNVNKEALTKWTEKILQGTLKSAGEAGKVTAAMSAAKIVTALAKSEMGDKDAFNEVADIFNPHKIGQEFFSLMLPLTVAEIPHIASNSRHFKEALFDAGKNSEEYRYKIEKLVDEGKMTEAEGKQRKEVINVMANISKSIPETNPVTNEKLTRSQQVEYAYNRVKETAQQAKKEGVKGDVALSQLYDKNAKELVDERKAIIEGTHEEYKATVDLYDRIKEKGTHDMSLKAGTKTEGVTYLQEQALTTPNGIKNSLKGDVDLTTDLIARNNPIDIKAEIKDLKQKKAKLEDSEKKAEANDIQRHIDLLEQGLEKTKAPKEENVVDEVIPEVKEPLPKENAEDILSYEREQLGERADEVLKEKIEGIEINKEGDVVKSKQPQMRRAVLKRVKNWEIILDKLVNCI